MIPITTPAGVFRVWTQRSGPETGPQVLLLHGGPGATHEYFESLIPALVEAGFGVIAYDQLGSHASDQPSDPALWSVERFVDEVEQVRVALGLDATNLVLLGHSWGGVLGIEYALAHGENVRALIISNMMSSIPAYNRYAREVIMPTIDPVALARIQELEATGETAHPDYEALLMEHHYIYRVLRQPADEWPEPVVRSFAHLNPEVYVPMQGPSELGASGLLVEWDRSADLARITVPTLLIGAEHDTMDPDYLRLMAQWLPQGSYLHCPDGSHMAMWDDPDHYIPGVIDFVRHLL
jgi:proline iminopeptidase